MPRDKCELDPQGNRPDDWPVCSGYIEPPPREHSGPSQREILSAVQESSVKQSVALILSDGPQEFENLLHVTAVIQQLLDQGVSKSALVASFNRISSNPHDYGITAIPTGVTVQMDPAGQIHVLQDGKPVSFQNTY